MQHSNSIGILPNALLLKWSYPVTVPTCTTWIEPSFMVFFLYKHVLCKKFLHGHIPYIINFTFQHDSLTHLLWCYLQLAQIRMLVHHSCAIYNWPKEECLFTTLVLPTTTTKKLFIPLVLPRTSDHPINYVTKELLQVFFLPTTTANTSTLKTILQASNFSFFLILFNDNHQSNRTFQWMDFLTRGIAYSFNF